MNDLVTFLRPKPPTPPMLPPFFRDRTKRRSGRLVLAARPKAPMAASDVRSTPPGRAGRGLGGLESLTRKCGPRGEAWYGQTLYLLESLRKALNISFSTSIGILSCVINFFWVGPVGWTGVARFCFGGRGLTSEVPTFCSGCSKRIFHPPWSLSSAGLAAPATASRKKSILPRAAVGITKTKASYTSSLFPSVTWKESNCILCHILE